MSSINERIKNRRKELGLSVDKIAEMLDISRASYYRYEGNEIYNMPLISIAPLAKILQVSPAWIMGWENDKDNYVSSDEKRIIQKLRLLNEDDQEDVEAVIDAKLSRKERKYKKDAESFG